METEPKLRQLQLVELEILNEFVRVCEAYNLHYFLVGGTLLGAVRHQGFIPWDDDIDVAMLREDYDRFARIAAKELVPQYFYQSADTDSRYFLSYAKVRKNGTEVYEERFRNSEFHKGIYIDMLGYTRKFMEEKYEEIIDFAELRDFQDRPFKQLSSGMKSRLAFSIASLVQPDILILDEVLSVGDGAFRRKSEAKMKEIITGGATTILVSHSIQQVREMCNKVLWLEKGNQVGFGEAGRLCDLYQGYLDGAVSLDGVIVQMKV